jgi:hypothetical protein
MRIGQLARRAVLFAVATCGMCGCADRSGMSPVRGRVTLAGGETAQLAGHTIEAALSTDRTVRAFGVIDRDGRFSLETLDHGTVKRGAREGTYVVRVVLTREGDGRDPPPPFAPRFQEFETSGLTLQVPAKDEVRLELTARP